MADATMYAAAVDDAVVRHWSHGALERAILDGLSALGLDPGRVEPQDLAPVDELHMGGHEATVHLARQMSLTPGMELLDIGCGIGGPARHFARDYGCRVVGIDLTPEYVAVAETLTRMVGPTERATFQVASATELPFPAARFDAATLIHVAMNIPDKARLCAEAARVLKPGGVFGVYEVMQTGTAELIYPVAWADSAELSFVEPPANYRAALEAAGFEVVAEAGRREAALDFFRRVAARLAESGPPALGLHILMGSEAPRKIANLIANLERGTIAPVEIICRRH